MATQDLPSDLAPADDTPDPAFRPVPSASKHHARNRGVAFVLLVAAAILGALVLGAEIGDSSGFWQVRP